MAPRSVKAKKAADLKVSENEVPLKGKGKEKKVADPDVDAEEEEIPVVEKKSKRGKKATEGRQANGDGASAKKGKKKSDEEAVIEDPGSNEDNSEDAESVPAEDNEQNDDDTETNGQSEEVQVAPAGRGRKKQAKKETADIKPKESNRGKRNVKQNETDDSKKETNDDKPKGRGRGRKAAPKQDIEPEEDDEIAEVESKPATKGRKKAQGKATKEKIVDSENEESQEEQKDLDDPEEEPEPKKGGRGKKNAGKKAKAEIEDKEEASKEEPATKKRKVTKKDDKGKGDSKDEEEMEEDAPEPKPVKGKRGQKKVVEKPVEAEEEVQDTGEPTNKRRRKQADDKVSNDDSKKKAPGKGKPATDYESIDFSNPSKNTQGKEWNFKIASWNVDGVRAWLGKGGLEYIQCEKPDILCLQELKCSKEKLPEEITNLPGYHAYWLSSDKDGYAGVGIYTTKLAMNVQYGLQDEELDSEGRIITAEYEQFYLICTYVPNSGRKLVTLPKRLKWNEEFRKHVQSLDKKKPVIICGDMNVSHKEIDLTNPKTNRKNAGFTDEERAGMTELLGDGFVDTFRHLYPNETGAYTFWTYMFNCRAKNVGWRLDYFIVSERLLPAVCDSVIRGKVLGSDHCPISLFLHLSTADKPKE